MLRAEARQLTPEEISSAEIQTLIESMKETMRDAPGVGLAAPQIGYAIQLVVIEDSAELQASLSPEQLASRERTPVPFHVLINPVLEFHEEEKVEFYEGCLSVAGFAAVTPRYRSVTVTALDQNGNQFSRHATGWYARILQHEIDHINGILYIDRMNSRTFSNTQKTNKCHQQVSD